MEHKLNEQWVEELDGKRHMLKAVQSDHLCSGCAFSCTTFCRDPLMSERDIACSQMIIIKDLGILNEDGCLPSSWGGYPEVIRVGKPNFVTYFKVSLVVKYGDGSGIQIHVTGKTKQQAIDAWNRRA